MTTTRHQLVKRPTGIPGLDGMTQGGMPAAGGVLVLGKPASGKTVLALQILARAIERGEGAVFASFEESREQVLRDAASFTWGAAFEQSEHVELIDARPWAGAQVSGDFDLDGLLAAIGLCVERTAAVWLVCDGIDQLLRRQSDPLLAIDQVQALSDWCEARQLTLILTGKMGDDGTRPNHLEGAEFLLPTIFVLSTALVGHRLSRRFRIAKYRAAAHLTEEVAMIMDGDGLHLPFGERELQPPMEASTQRISTGIPSLDDVLGGGLYRTSTTLISGQPGTAKTTLSGRFAASAAQRGERVLYVSFDELQTPVVRNLRSVGIELQPYLDAGLLRFYSRESWSALVEEHSHAIHRLLKDYSPHCLIIDPISAMLKAPGADSAYTAIERLIAFAQGLGATTLLTSLGTQDDPRGEATLSQTSTLADAWIVLDFNVRAGERNRSLSVVKSRGSRHSNQVRELILSSGAIDLADVYEYGTEVLMGTARLQKESEELAEQQRRELEQRQREQALRQQIERAEREVEQLRHALALEEALNIESTRGRQRHAQDVIERRGAHSQPAEQRDASCQAGSKNGGSKP